MSQTLRIPVSPGGGAWGPLPESTHLWLRSWCPCRIQNSWQTNESDLWGGDPVWLSRWVQSICCAGLSAPLPHPGPRAPASKSRGDCVWCSWCVFFTEMECSLPNVSELCLSSTPVVCFGGSPGVSAPGLPGAHSCSQVCLLRGWTCFHPHLSFCCRQRVEE